MAEVIRLETHLSRLTSPSLGSFSTICPRTLTHQCTGTAFYIFNILLTGAPSTHVQLLDRFEYNFPIFSMD